MAYSVSPGTLGNDILNILLNHGTGQRVFSDNAGARKLFDENIVYPAPVFKYPDGTIGYYYYDDFPRPGREWWFRVSYDFN
ncbi:hypothetical protein QUF80_19990 [Desulfococcaceae bacterium HSG8]|nr:hypothetical protein [Desulfococcaceae bacterium HSG8]